MKKGLTTFVVALLVVCGSMVAWADGSTVTYGIPVGNSFIPKGTLIEAELVTGVNSGDHEVNSVAYFKLRQNVLVDGVVVLPYGTVGTATVIEAEPGSYLGKEGKLTLRARDIQALNGARIPLSFETTKYGGPIDKNLPYQLVSLYSLGGHKFGWFYSLFHGGEASAPVGLRFQVAVEQDADLGCVPEDLTTVMIRRY